MRGEWLPGKPNLLHVRPFISRPEAQEPVSIAQNARGDIFVTFEDGWNAPQEVSQRYGVYRRDLKPIKPLSERRRIGRPLGMSPRRPTASSCSIPPTGSTAAASTTSAPATACT